MLVLPVFQEVRVDKPVGPGIEADPGTMLVQAFLIDKGQTVCTEAFLHQFHRCSTDDYRIRFHNHLPHRCTFIGLEHESVVVHVLETALQALCMRRLRRNECKRDSFMRKQGIAERQLVMVQEIGYKDYAFHGCTFNHVLL